LGVSFTKGATTVTTLSEAERGYTRRLEKSQAFGRTAANTLYVYDKGTGIERASIVIVALTDAEHTALNSFFHTTVNGMELDFTYVDEAGDSMSARFLSPELVWEKQGRNIWNVSFDLEVW